MVDAINGLQPPIVVVGHSSDSATISLVPDQTRVDRLIYVTAFVLEPGRSIVDIAGVEVRDTILSIVGSVSFIDRLSFRRWKRFEEVVARAVGSNGPVHALKEPNTRMPPLGAIREAVPDDAWHGRIVQLMDEAKFIVVFAARTQHCAVEFRDRVTAACCTGRCS